jgi:hypothetical protein
VRATPSDPGTGVENTSRLGRAPRTTERVRRRYPSVRSSGGGIFCKLRKGRSRRRSVRTGKQVCSTTSQPSAGPHCVPNALSVGQGMEQPIKCRRADPHCTRSVLQLTGSGMLATPLGYTIPPTLHAAPPPNVVSRFQRPLWRAIAELRRSALTLPRHCPAAYSCCRACAVAMPTLFGTTVAIIAKRRCRRFGWFRRS